MLPVSNAVRHQSIPPSHLSAQITQHQWAFFASLLASVQRRFLSSCSMSKWRADGCFMLTWGYNDPVEDETSNLRLWRRKLHNGTGKMTQHIISSNQWDLHRVRVHLRDARSTQPNTYRNIQSCQIIIVRYTMCCLTCIAHAPCHAYFQRLMMH